MTVRILEVLLPMLLLFMLGCEQDDPTTPENPDTRGTVAGTISDRDTGRAIVGAEVWTVPPTEPKITGASGSYAIDHVNPGLYEVHAKNSGYITDYRTVEIVAGITRTADVPLAPDSGLDPMLDVEPSTLNFGAEGEVLQLELRNVGTGQIRFTASATGYEWISFADELGVFERVLTRTFDTPNTTISVKVDRSGLAWDSYVGAITINGDEAGASTVQVIMAVPGDGPILTPSLVTLDFGSSQDEIEFDIWNDGKTGSLHWQISDDIGWLDLDNYDDETRAGQFTTVTATVDRNGLPPASYSQQFIIRWGTNRETAITAKMLVDSATPPLAHFTVSPEKGSIDTVFEVDAKESRPTTDPMDELEYRWEWGDGRETTWDMRERANVQYDNAGEMEITLYVRDSGLRESHTSRKVIVSSSGVSDNEPNDSVNEAQPIEAYAPVLGTIGYDTDTRYDWFSFSPRQNGRAKVTIENTSKDPEDYIGTTRILMVEGSERVFSTLRESNREYIRPGPPKESSWFTVSEFVEYFIKIGTFETRHGSYRLSLQYESEPHVDHNEPNDSKNSAVDIQVDQTIHGLIGFHSDLDSVDHDDWYGIAPQSHGTITVTFFNDSPEGRLLGATGLVEFLRADETLTSLAENNRSYTLPRGVYRSKKTSVSVGHPYYIHVPKYDAENIRHSAPYAIETVFSPLPHGDTAEPNDTQGSASSIEVNTDIAGSIGYMNPDQLPDQSDWYVFSPPADGSVRVQVKNDHDADILRGHLGETALSMDVGDQGPPRMASVYRSSTYRYVEPDLTRASYRVSVSSANQYYLQMVKYESHFAPYTLSTDFIPEPVADLEGPDDSAAEARLLPPSQTGIHGTVGYGSDKEDWFRVSMLSDGNFSFSIQNLHESDIVYSSMAAVTLYRDTSEGVVEVLRVADNTSSRPWVPPGNRVYHSTTVEALAGEEYLILVPRATGKTWTNAELQQVPHATAYRLETSLSPGGPE